MSDNEGYGIVKKIIEVIKINGDKNIKWIYELKNKFILFIYYLKLFLNLSYIIKFFYQIYLIFLMT